MSFKVMGLDLSLTRAAAVVVPGTFGADVDWAKVVASVFGYELKSVASEKERMNRCLHIAKFVVELASANGINAIFIEQYAFNRAFNAARLGELGGIVKTQLMLSTGMCPKPIIATSARKLLMGRLPSAKSMGLKSLPKGFQKEYTRDFLNRSGAPEMWKDDECDAFVVANAGLNECGKTFLTVGRD